MTINLNKRKLFSLADVFAVSDGHLIDPKGIKGLEGICAVMAHLSGYDMELGCDVVEGMIILAQLVVMKEAAQTELLRQYPVLAEIEFPQADFDALAGCEDAQQDLVKAWYANEVNKHALYFAITAAPEAFR